MSNLNVIEQVLFYFSTVWQPLCNCQALCTVDIGGAVAYMSQVVTFVNLIVVHCQDQGDFMEDMVELTQKTVGKHWGNCWTFFIERWTNCWISMKGTWGRTFRTSDPAWSWCFDQGRSVLGRHAWWRALTSEKAKQIEANWAFFTYINMIDYTSLYTSLYTSYMIIHPLIYMYQQIAYDIPYTSTSIQTAYPPTSSIGETKKSNGITWKIPSYPNYH